MKYNLKTFSSDSNFVFNLKVYLEEHPDYEFKQVVKISDGRLNVEGQWLLVTEDKQSSNKILKKGDIIDELKEFNNAEGNINQCPSACD